ELPKNRSGDEVGALTDSFDHMRQAIKEYVADLTETTRAKERIESELKIARTIQMSFLPKKFPPFPHRKEFEIFAALEPAKEVGGDLYDFFLLDEEHLFFSVGDVSDKGVPAALFMAVTKTLMKGIAEHHVSPSDVLARVNEELCSENDSNMFVTLVCGILNVRTGELLYSNAGHNPPIFSKQGRAPEWLELPPGLVLGAMEGVPYQTKRIMLNPGDSLLVHTDGVTEAMNDSKEIYSDERLLKFMHDIHGRNPEENVQQVMHSVKEYAGDTPQSDDITLLSILYKGSTG
ncbi:MAG: SpoIIE family protein phosphatase, partial [Desulfovibrionales bacterium]